MKTELSQQLTQPFIKISKIVNKIVNSYRDVLSKNSHKFPVIISSRNICSFAVKSFMMIAIALL